MLVKSEELGLLVQVGDKYTIFKKYNLSAFSR